MRILWCLLLAFSNLAAQEPSVKDAAYGPDERHKLDLWQAKGDSMRPLVIFIHGGGWAGGDKGDIPPALLKTMLTEGISVASINYRYSTIAPLPAPVHDAARAVQFLRQHSEEWNIDAARIAAYGISAGATTTLWLACHDDLADPKSSDPVFRQSTRLCAAVGMSPQTSLEPEIVTSWVGPEVLKHPMIDRAAPPDLPNRGQLLKEFSPITHVSAGDPAMLISNPRVDPLPAKDPGSAIHHALFGQKFAAVAATAGVSCSLRLQDQPDETPTPEQFLIRHLADPQFFDETKVTTLFAFDQHAFPHTQNLSLKMRQPERYAGNPVLRRGEPGEVDAKGVQFYGSILKENGKYRMWYVAFDDDVQNRITTSRWRPAYAESDDGIHWRKPELGLVDYHGSKANNLVLTTPGPWGFVNLKVIRDEGETDPNKRYKMSAHVYFRHNTRLGSLATFASPDGLKWTMLTGAKPLKAELRKEDLLLPGVHFEPCGGLYQWDGQYFICGQNALPDVHHYQGRVVRLYRSADFVNWSATSTLAFVRSSQINYLGPGRSREGEQNHEGISVWNRGNVLLGIAGRWHGAAAWKDVSVDLGFVVSDDGLHFREPHPEWTFLEHGKDGEWDQGGLLQGQGFENIGNETFIYYGTWDPRPTGGKEVPRGGVGIAKLPRDRFGDLVVDESGKGPGDYQLPEITSELISASMSTNTGEQYFINADGLSDDARLRVELMDHQERPLPDYAGDNAVVLTRSGFQEPVVWKKTSPLPQRVRLHVVFEGKQNTSIRFSAIYISQPAVQR